ncbi:MAG: SAM-dependent chlorinase/fluorinase, partial [Okeania sp. SIO1H5]|uniref:SAM hydrolase/SAM-dependent halogenase family protein n=1 Tax=Okeania sp. SIO1H5 TaxID=2607777 RepID=UPI0013B756B8
PGVGSDRDAIALSSQGRYFVGPDNGLFSLLGSIPSDIVRLDEPKYHGIQSSHTFHGRDIFAPVSGYLSMGVPLSQVGSSKSDYIKLPSPKIEETAHSVRGEIVYYDRFGNGITSIVNEHPLLSQKVTVVLDGTEKVSLERFFQAVTPGKTVAYPGSCGYLEVGINQGSLRRETGLEIGTEVRVVL